MSSPWLGLRRYTSLCITESVVLVLLLRLTPRQRSIVSGLEYIGETVYDYSFMLGPDALPATPRHPYGSLRINQTLRYSLGIARSFPSLVFQDLTFTSEGLLRTEGA